MNHSSFLRAFLVLSATVLLFGCGPSSDLKYDSGYNDGYSPNLFNLKLNTV